ncbi:MAG TPA: hypothetical protein VGB73_03815 [Pyrinomonadaceae bacterium]
MFGKSSIQEIFEPRTSGLAPKILILLFSENLNRRRVEARLERAGI